MPRLEIPEESLSRYIKLVNDTRIYWEGEYGLEFLEQFIEDNTPLPCPHCQCTESSEYILRDSDYKCRRCDDCGACGPAVGYIDGAEGRSITGEWNRREGEWGVCLWCGRNEPEEFEIDSKHHIWCDWCQASGPEADTPERAMELWRKGS